MSIQSEINRISGNISDSLDEVALKGVTVPAGSNSDDLPGLIRLIEQSGGSGVGGVIYQDEDGYLVLSEEAANVIGITRTLDENGGEILDIVGVSLAEDTVTPETLAQGVTAHNAAGEAIIGTMSGGDKSWQRPAEWPDYSKLPNLKTNNVEAQFFTYDNRDAAIGVQGEVGLFANCSVTTAGVIRIDRVTIGNDGTITVLETNTYNQNTSLKFNIPLDAGDYVCYRLTPVSGHITGIAMDSMTNGTADKQRCVEHFGNLPYCTTYGGQSASRFWGVHSLESETILSLPSAMTRLSLQYADHLVNVPSDTWPTTKVAVANATSMLNRTPQLTSFPFEKFDFSAVTTLSGFCSNSGIEHLDLSGSSLSNCTNINSLANTCMNLKTARLPALPAVANNSNVFYNCFALDVVELEGAAGTSGKGINNTFSTNTTLKSLILRSTSVVPLENTAGVSGFLPGQGRVYVPSSILATYKTETNWSTYADYILPIEGSYWETHRADGSEIATT